MSQSYLLIDLRVLVCTDGMPLPKARRFISARFLPTVDKPEDFALGDLRAEGGKY